MKSKTQTAPATAAHTLAPWEVREMDNDKVIPTLTVIGRTARGNHIYVAKVDRSEDARLIAASPDLLAALEVLVSLRDHPLTVATLEVAYRNARAALAKARQ